jgi:UDP-N-acetylglucosamine 4-epimerase
MHKPPHHTADISSFSFLVTGGAGFIGSNIVAYLLRHGAGRVRVLDNLSEGRIANIGPFIGRDDFQFIEGDITDPKTCLAACEGIDYVSHQAALGSVPRSIETPLKTNAANVTGFLNMLTAAKDAGVRRFVYASSSSVYGDSIRLPKVEEHIGSPLSPYAASKFVNEVYAGVYALNYDMELIGLRYFNIFGPNQKPEGPYAAVIPLFMDALLNNRRPFINGDGKQSRDFTYVDNAVQANIRALMTTVQGATGQVYNIACGERYSVNELFHTIRDIVGSDIEPVYREERRGDVRDSLADISKARAYLGYNPTVKLREGMVPTLEWFRENYAPQTIITGS